ncbi:MAG: hypothetical protein QNK37_38840, partial [Acidobacteriota bacterium]|nr:hypothetical protein [Acidobacteriota bacterium]
MSPFFQQQEAQLKAFFNHLTNIDPKQFHLHGFERPHVCNAWIPALLSADRADLDAWVSAHIPHTWFHNFPNGLDLPTITGLHGIARVRQFLAMNQFTGIAFYRPTEWEARELAAYFCDAYDGGRLFDLLCAYWYRHFVTNPDALLKDVTAHSISAVDLIQGKEPTFPSIHPSLGRCFLTGRLTRNILCNQLPW